MQTETRQKRPQRTRRQPNRTLYALRLNAGLSREDLGRRAGVSKETIRLAESGFVPTVRVQFAIAEAFSLLPLDLWPIENQRLLRRVA